MQLDPISVVARSHQLVLWSRLGPYALPALDKLLWSERRLFEYWAHCASIVLTEDYPLHAALMRRYPRGASAWSTRIRNWVQQNADLKRHLLGQVRRHGPVRSGELEDLEQSPAFSPSMGWTSGRALARMLDYLWLSGQVMVTGRQGLQKIWDLSERWLPAWTPRDRLSEREVTRRAARRALRALGAATPRQIEQHFLRGRYAQLPAVLAELERAHQVERVQIKAGGEAWPGEWYLSAEAAARLPALTDDWQPRVTLLSPFDNLICDRRRTRQLFDFEYSIEIYTPAAKRRYGYYVLPVLQGDQLIGRIDPAFDRAERCLNVQAVYAEPAAARPAGWAVRQAIEDLAVFLGARKINYNKRRLPAVWKPDLV